MGVLGIGHLVADKYKVERRLGEGDTGYVVAARHEQLDQQVAIKVLKPELCESDEAVARFLREARASVPFQSEHAARVLDVGTLDDGAPYLVMEFLEGRDLSRELDERVTLPVAEAVDYVLQVCEALAEAHTLGIAHRDLKPTNLFCVRLPDGSALIKVLDFGISKAIPHGSVASLMHLTATQASAGSPHYMSPEQVRNPETVDTRSDIWSLGIILHELLTGYPPRVSNTPRSMLMAVAIDDLRSQDDASVGLEEVILRCLDREASGRYVNVVELARALNVYTPTGAATMARIFGIVRNVEERGGAGAGLALASRAGPPIDTPTLESPRMPTQIPTGEHDASATWDPPLVRAWPLRWAAVALGAAAAVGMLIFTSRLGRTRTNAASEGAPIATPFAVQANGIPPKPSSTALPDRDAATDFESSDRPSFSMKPSEGPRGLAVQGRQPVLAGASKTSRAKPPDEKLAAPPKSSLPDPPALDDTPDPLDGRF